MYINKREEGDASREGRPLGIEGDEEDKVALGTERVAVTFSRSRSAVSSAVESLRIV